MSRAVVGVVVAMAALGGAIAFDARPTRAAQPGGSILYEDPAAAGQHLEFRAYVWRTSDGSYWRSTGQYREVGATTWKGLESNWGWYSRQALRAQVTAARFLASDGYLWRFENPRPAPARAERIRFTEKCWLVGACVASLRAEH